MLNEIGIAIVLTLCTTALLYFIATFFSKKYNIKHPKNTFLIYAIVLLTAFSIFPFAAIAFSTSSEQPADTELTLPSITGTPISDSTIITEDQNITYASSITPVVDSNDHTSSHEPTRYIQKITWNELIIFDKYQPSETKIITRESTSNPPVNTSQFLRKTLTTLKQDGMSTPELINQIITNLIIDQSKSSQQESPVLQETPEKEATISATSPSDYNYFFYPIIILFFISLVYIFSSIYFGKIYTLKRLQATQCKDKHVIDLITRLSKEFKIKPPKVYIYDGAPNAFVFGIPAILAFSSELCTYLSKKEFEAALRHELAHIKHHDHLIKPLLQGMRIFFFYNPFVHLLCLKMMKNMEILADNATFSSKKEKISLMEALIKISEYTNKTPLPAIPSYQIPLISYHSEKLTLTERFSNLFENTSKKTVITLMVSAIIILTNISLFFVAGAVFETKNSTEDQTIQQQFSIDESYYSESVTYTKVERNMTTYFALVIQRNLYNVISAKPSSSDIIEDVISRINPNHNMMPLDYYDTEPF